jgi:hypothetical protein
MTDRAVLLLLSRVCEAVYDATESFEQDYIGTHLAYLTWQIVRGQHTADHSVDWTTEDTQPILRLFRELFVPTDRVWDYIELP